MITAAKIFSTLGNPQSIVPLGVKDCFNGAGMTVASSVTNKDEGVDRFIDEFGTEAIWLGGIPLSKKVIDKTLFKTAKLDAGYDVRNLKNNDIFEKTKKWAPNEKVKNDIEKIGANKKLFKNLNVAKFIASTAFALGAYNFMTDLKQRYTNNKIKNKLIKKEEEKSITLMNNKSDNHFKNEHYNKNKDLNFQNFSVIRTKKSDNENAHIQSDLNFKGVYDIMLNPVKNMFILDMGITSERLTKSRSPQEFVGYAIKECGFLFFMYYLGQKVQNHFEDVAEKKHGKSMALDARVLGNESFKQSFADKSIENSLNSFPKDVSDIKLYDYINLNPENMVVDFAKQSDIIQTYKKPNKWYQILKKKEDTGKIDTRKYIDFDSLREVHSNISKLYEQYNNSCQNVDEFFKGVRKLKRGSILKNMGSTVMALGVILPSIMLANRLLKPDNKEFAVERKLKEELKKEESSNM